VRRSALRSKETRDAIVAAASRLFSQRDYQKVTMREIAREAACSHTAIYQYFAGKEILLFELSAPYLERLRSTLEKIRDDASLSDQERLSEIGLSFVEFGLSNRPLMRVLVQVEASRVDELSPAGRINEFRLSVFAIIQAVLSDSLGLSPSDDRLLMFSRNFFYLLHGMVITYELSKENAQELLVRLRPTMLVGFSSCLSGFREELKKPQ